LLVASDEKSAELENTTGELTDQKEISIEPNNIRELQIYEIIAKQDQPSEESDAKETEPDQATVEVSAVEYSEFNATVSASVEEGVDISRELQIDQAQIMAELDELAQEYAVKPTELDHATDEVSTVDISEVNATVSASVEETEEVSVAKVEGVVQEEEVAGEMPIVEIEKIEATDEKHTEEEVNLYILCLRKNKLSYLVPPELCKSLPSVQIG
jgi:hypothetical protein